MEVPIRDHLKIVRFLDLANMFGPTEKPTKDNGHKIKCTVKES